MGNLTNVAQWRLCPQCDMTCRIPHLHPGTRASCPRCHTTLQTEWHGSPWRSAIYAICALFMLLLANLFPFIGMEVAGLTNQITLLNIPSLLINQNFRSLALIFILLVQLLPACCLIFIILISSGSILPTPFKKKLTRYLFWLRGWGMAEIFMAGILVSFVKLMAYGAITLGLSFWAWCLFCILELKAFQSVDRAKLWLSIEPLPELAQQPEAGRTGLSQGLRRCGCCSAIIHLDSLHCPRCQTKGSARKKQSIQLTLALLLTSVILYIPANVLPIMVTDALGDATGSTIMAGVALLWNDGSWPIALVIFIASIMVPCLKMLAIGWLSYGVKSRRQPDLHRLNLVYELVELVGRWSMIDVFVIAILSALVQIGGLMSVYPAWGVILFAVVVILTMLASMSFDPRLLWDRESVTHVEGQDSDSE